MRTYFSLDLGGPGQYVLFLFSIIFVSSGGHFDQSDKATCLILKAIIMGIICVKVF